MGNGEPLPKLTTQQQKEQNSIKILTLLLFPQQLLQEPKEKKNSN